MPRQGRKSADGAIGTISTGEEAVSTQVAKPRLKSGIPACTFNQRHKFRRKGCSPWQKCRYCGAPAPRRIMLEIAREKAQGEYCPA